MMRSGLQSVLDDQNEDDSVRTLARVLMNNFNKHWGSGVNGTVFADHHTERENRRPCGIPLAALLAAALNPHTKNLGGIGDLDRRSI